MRQDAKFQVEQELKIPSHILQSGESVEVLASDWDTNVSTLYLTLHKSDMSLL
mgnify:CR=1 FL=1